MLKRILKNMCKCLFLFSMVSLSACQGTGGNQEIENSPTNTPPPSAAADSAGVETLVAPQLIPPNEGEQLALLHTTMGDITLRFFPEEAPLAVENFIKHAQNGYYDGVSFHRVMNDFMIQGGDPEGTGMGGESIWGGGFGTELSIGLRHFRGALAMAHSSLPDSNGSQFYIVQRPDIDESHKEFFNSMYDMQEQPIAETEEGLYLYGKQLFPTAILDEYIHNGGTPHLDLVMNEQGHTVFGHVVEGMDVVDAIAAVPVDANDKPLTDVLIESISFIKYSSSNE